MFQPTFFEIFLLGASKSDFQEKILHYKVINYKITCLLNLEIYLGTSLLCQRLTLN